MTKHVKSTRNHAQGGAVISLLALALATAPAAEAQPLRPDGTVDATVSEDPPPATKSETEVSDKRDTGTNMQEAPDTVIRNIKFVGDGVPQNVAAVAQSHIGEYATTANLRALAADMTDAFEKSSVPLYTFSIPEQDLSRGTIRILVKEGHVGAVVLKGETDSGGAPLVRKIMAKIVDKQPLSRNEYERALLLVDQIPGQDTKSTLSTMKQPGAVALSMNLDTSRPTLGFGFETRGPSYVNDGVVRANANAYSVLRSGDHTQFTLSGTVSDENLRYGSLFHSTPIGSDGLRLSASGALIRTRSGLLKGEASSAALGLSYPILLTKRNRVNASLSLDRLDASNAFLGSVVAAERNWTARASLTGQIFREKTSAGGRITFAQGLDIFDARVSPLIAETEFTYVDGLAQVTQAIGDSIILRAAAKGRWSEEPLPAAERFTLGGADFGRAFDNAVLNGDRGYGAYSEVAVRPISGGDFKRSEIYGFIDEGKTTLLDRPLFDKTSFSIGSWGGGVRVAWTDRVKLGLEAANVRHAPAALRDDDWKFALSWSVDFRP